MRPIMINAWIIATAMLFSGVVLMPQKVFAGNSTVITEQQWGRMQRKQQLSQERFERLLQQERAQRELMMAWHKKARLQQAKQKSRSASKRERKDVVVAASR